MAAIGQDASIFLEQHVVYLRALRVLCGSNAEYGMKGPNLSAWALAHQQMVLFLIIVLMGAGVISYLNLGRAEDPDFTFKVMVVRTLWPGAMAQSSCSQLISSDCDGSMTVTSPLALRRRAVAEPLKRKGCEAIVGEALVDTSLATRTTSFAAAGSKSTMSWSRA